jgi:hypothetical protein
LRRWSCSAFFVLGLTGLALCVAFGVLLTLHRGPSLWVLGAAVLTAVATFLALVMITKIIVGEERLIYYHQEVAILATVMMMPQTPTRIYHLKIITSMLKIFQGLAVTPVAETRLLTRQC